jgi:hypothetical protein
MSDEETIVQARVLDLNDRQSPAWRKLKAHLELRLQELRMKNDNDLDAIETAKTRGAIKTCTNLLALGDQDPATEADEDS